METVIFKVQGSAKEPYVVSFKLLQMNITASCSCPAGELGQLCKHRINIMSGSIDGIVSGNEADVQVIASWLRNTDVERILNQIRDAESRYEEARKQIGVLKKQLARKLQG